jgi:hypothetical protein
MGEVVEDEAKIVASTAQQSVDCATAHNGEEVAVQATVSLHVADGWFAGAAAQLTADGRGDAATLTGDDDTSIFPAYARDRAIHLRPRHGNTGHALNLGKALPPADDHHHDQPRAIAPSTNPTPFVAATEA